MSSPDCQDWQEVKIHNKEYYKKATAQKQNAAGTKRFNELNEDEVPKMNKITQEQRQALMDARNAKGWDRAKLGGALNVSKKIIEEYENGTVSDFKPAFYKRMMNVLGVKTT